MEPATQDFFSLYRYLSSSLGFRLKISFRITFGWTSIQMICLILFPLANFLVNILLYLLIKEKSILVNLYIITSAGIVRCLHLPDTCHCFLELGMLALYPSSGLSRVFISSELLVLVPQTKDEGGCSWCAKNYRQ